MNKFFFSTLILALFSTPVLAQNGVKLLTLEECLGMAFKNNSDLKTAVYRVDRAGANVKGSYSSILPRIQTTFSSGRFIQGDRTLLQDVLVGFDSTANQAVFEQQSITQEGASRNSHSVAISYSQTVFDFGRSWNTIKQTKASFEASSSSLTSTRQTVYSTVKERYFELLKAQNLEREFKLAVERSREQLNRTQSMFEIGSVAQVDVYRSEVILGTDEVNYINQQTRVKIARGNLNIVIGRDPENALDIVETEAAVVSSKYTLDEAFSIAEQKNPNLRRFESDMNGADYGMKAAKGAYLPSIGVNATYRRDNSEFNSVYGDLNNNFSVSLGAQVSFNIFNGFSDAAEVGRQSANYAIARESWVSEKRKMELSVKQAYLNLQAFGQISEINERSLRAAEEEFRLAQERYRVGAGTQLEVTEAQVSLTRARVSVVRSKYDAMIAQAQLEAAMGVIAIDQN